MKLKSALQGYGIVLVDFKNESYVHSTSDLGWDCMDTINSNTTYNSNKREKLLPIKNAGSLYRHNLKSTLKDDYDFERVEIHSKIIPLASLIC